MSESVLAVCDPCGKHYRVADATKTYACKACEDGRVRAVAEGSPEAVAEKPAEASGNSEERPARRGRAAKASARDERSTDETREAAGKTVRLVQLAFALHVVLSAVSLYFFLASDDVAWSTGAFAAIALVLATQTAVALVGALNARWSPFACACALAALWLVGKVLRATAGEGLALETGLGVFDLIFGFALFATILPAAGAQKSLERFPDLYDDEHDAALSIDPELRGQAAMRVTSALRAREEARSRTRLRTAIAVAGIYAVAGAGVWATYAWNRIEEPAAALDRLRAAWNDANVTALAAEFGPDRRDLAAGQLASRVEPHAWTEWPSLSMTGLERTEERLTASFDVGFDHGVVSAIWNADGAVWRLQELSIPPPELGPLAIALRDAWNAEDLEAVVAIFRPDDPPATRKELWNLLVDRGWNDDWPTIDGLGETTYRSEENRAEQTMTFDTGVPLSVVWRLSEGHWSVHRLRLPER